MVHKIVILISVIFFSATVFSQDFDAYRKQQQEKFSQLKKRNENKFKDLQESYRLYVQQQNKEFARYVENSWKDFNTIKGEKRPENQKPKVIPKFSERKKKLVSKKVKAIGTDSIIISPKQTPDLLSIPVPATNKAVSNSGTTVLFYGQKINLSIDEALFIKEAYISKQTISKIWQVISSADYVSLTDQLYSLKDRFNLNDWGFLKLNNAVAAILANNDTNNQRIISWALMNLSGYKVKIGVYQNNCYLLIPAMQNLYSIYSLNINNEKYFILDYSGEKISTYEQDFNIAYKYFDFFINKPLNLGENISSVDISEEDEIRWLVDVNKNVIDFYNDYPLVDLSIYINAPMAAETRNSLANKLTPLLKNKTEIEKVSYLLNFVQNRFEYKTDREQFGREKFFFPDELFYYPFSDCEDRSVLFSYLVRWFVGYDVVGIRYSNHMATAVAFPDSVLGDYIEYDNKTYTICDPTYSNAPIGMAMPDYQNAGFKIVPVSNFMSRSEETEALWAGLLASDVSKSSMQNSCFDKKGNCYLTGTFSGTLTFNNKTIQSGADGTNIVVACFDNKSELIWMEKIDNGFFDYCSGIAINNNNLYLSGVSLSENGLQKQLSIFSFSDKGKKRWVKNFPVDSSYIGENISKIFYFTPQGNLITQKNIFSGSQVPNSGIYFEGDNLVAQFSFSNSLGLRKEDVIISSSSEMSIAERIKHEYSKIIKTSCEQYTAGLMALFNLMKFDGMSLTGAEINEILEKSSSKIPSVAEDLKESLKKIEYFKNENGRITVKTKAGAQVAFYKLYFTNGASIKVTNISSRKAKIECLSGVKVGNAFVKFSLNSILIDLPTGNFIFDYGKDHSKQSVNLRKDILEI